jgi:acyl-CoA thioester hydrolase
MDPFVWRSRIRFSDTDASGRIHYTALMRHFEAAEFEFLRSIGCSYMSLMPAEGGFPRVHVECDYLAALECDDEIETAVTVERVGQTSYTLAFAAAKGGQVAGRGKIVIVCMDRGTKRPKLLPERLSRALLESRSGEHLAD